MKLDLTLTVSYNLRLQSCWIMKRQYFEITRTRTSWTVFNMARMERWENLWIQDYPKTCGFCLDWFPSHYFAYNILPSFYKCLKFLWFCLINGVFFLSHYNDSSEEWKHCEKYTKWYFPQMISANLSNGTFIKKQNAVFLFYS